MWRQGGGRLSNTLYDTPKYLLAGCPTLVIGKAHHRRSTARTALNFIIFAIRLLSAPAALFAKSNIGNPCLQISIGNTESRSMSNFFATSKPF